RPRRDGGLRGHGRRRVLARRRPRRERLPREEADEHARVGPRRGGAAGPPSHHGARGRPGVDRRGRAGRGHPRRDPPPQARAAPGAPAPRPAQRAARGRAGALTSLAWPWLVLGWVGLVPWLAALDRTRSLADALASGLFMCVAFTLAVFGWFPSAIEDYTGAPWAVALLPVVCMAPLLEPQFVAFALGRTVARRAAAGPWRTALAGACIYVGTEWASPKLFADTLGHGLYASTWMRQAA